MTRWILLAVVVIALSAAATVAVDLLPEGKAPSGGPAHFPVKPEGPAPQATVKEGLEYDFGTMPLQTRGSRAWTIRNDGDGDLRVALGSTTCKCTVANLGKDGKAIVKPGDKTEIRLEWETKELEGSFRQSATVITSDPTRDQITFLVSGIVQPPILMVPPEPATYLGNVPNDQGTLANRAIYSPDRPNFEITSITSSRPDLIEGRLKSLTSAALKGFKVKAGYHLEILAKPTTALGPFAAELVLATDHPGRPEIRIGVSGKLVGPITPTPEEIRLTGVSGRKGGRATVALMVRGQEETKFEVEKSPTLLKVEVAKADQQPRADAKSSTLRQYRMTVTIPPGTEPGVITGPIVLKTDHPGAGRVTIPVHVLVSGAG